jgi:hypothetical protein
MVGLNSTPRASTTAMLWCSGARRPVGRATSDQHPGLRHVIAGLAGNGNSGVTVEHPVQLDGQSAGRLARLGGQPKGRLAATLGSPRLSIFPGMHLCAAIACALFPRAWQGREPMSMWRCWTLLRYDHGL